MVELSGVSFRAGDVDILRDVEVRFQPGRLNVVVPRSQERCHIFHIASWSTTMILALQVSGGKGMYQ